MIKDQTTIDKNALRAVALQFLINGAVVSTIIPRLPEIRDALAIDLSDIGQVLTMASIGGILGSLLSGWVLARLGTKKAMLLGTLITIVMLPLVAFASSVWSLFLILGIIMLLDPIIDIAMNLQGSNISARSEMPVMSRLHGLWSIGSVLGGLLAASMAMLAVPLAWHLLLASSLMLIGLIFLGGGLLVSDAEISSSKKEHKAAQRKTNKPIKLWVFAILGGTVFIPEMVAGDWSAFRAKDDLDSSLGVAGMAYVTFTCGMVIGRLSGDYLAVRLGKVKQFNRAILISCIGMSLVCLVDHLAIVFVGLFISGLGISVLFPRLYDRAAQDPHRPERALSAMTTGSRTFALIAPISIGFLADSEKLHVGLSMAIFTLPCLLLVGLLMGALIRKDT